MSEFDRRVRGFPFTGRLCPLALQHSIVRSKQAALSAAARRGFQFVRAALTQATIMTVALLASQSPGYSEFLVNGSRDNLVVKADQTPLSDIVDALGKKFDIRLKSQVSLDARVSGRFSGSLTSVLKRLFETYNFVLAQGQNGDTNSIVVLVLSQSNNADLSHMLPQPIEVPKIRHRDGRDE
jgi:hypothetical protein